MKTAEGQPQKVNRQSISLMNFDTKLFNKIRAIQMQHNISAFNAGTEEGLFLLHKGGLPVGNLFLQLTLLMNSRGKLYDCLHRG